MGLRSFLYNDLGSYCTVLVDICLSCYWETSQKGKILQIRHKRGII
ncbi:hypothetical protein SAMN05216405_2071 [Lachnospiraceae bacterium NLAE-zl-G231]|nr:hypothetical protein SAMN05216405_2071 [Lachnospiraceae bacterium NLAE-zl-G231]